MLTQIERQRTGRANENCDGVGFRCHFIFRNGFRSGEEDGALSSPRSAGVGGAEQSINIARDVIPNSLKK